MVMRPVLVLVLLVTNQKNVVQGDVRENVQALHPVGGGRVQNLVVSVDLPASHPWLKFIFQTENQQ